mmetsp:Transcript_61882/g.145558  ORF Transcript_61882/g.145558 Transcript_61882/m.145558 type:complete len:576 (-) Transcript_61882:1759-3486(-)
MLFFFAISSCSSFFMSASAFLIIMSRSSADKFCDCDSISFCIAAFFSSSSLSFASCSRFMLSANTSASRAISSSSRFRSSLCFSIISFRICSCSASAAFISSSKRARSAASCWWNASDALAASAAASLCACSSISSSSSRCSTCLFTSVITFSTSSTCWIILFSSSASCFRFSSAAFLARFLASCSSSASSRLYLSWSAASRSAFIFFSASLSIRSLSSVVLELRSISVVSSATCLINSWDWASFSAVMRASSRCFSALSSCWTRSISITRSFSCSACSFSYSSCCFFWISFSFSLSWSCMVMRSAFFFFFSASCAFRSSSCRCRSLSMYPSSFFRLFECPSSSLARSDSDMSSWISDFICSSFAISSASIFSFCFSIRSRILASSSSSCFAKSSSSFALMSSVLEISRTSLGGASAATDEPCRTKIISWIFASSLVWLASSFFCFFALRAWSLASRSDIAAASSRTNFASNSLSAISCSLSIRARSSADMSLSATESSSRCFMPASASSFLALISACSLRSSDCVSTSVSLTVLAASSSCRIATAEALRHCSSSSSTLDRSVPSWIAAISFSCC